MLNWNPYRFIFAVFLLKKLNQIGLCKSMIQLIRQYDTWAALVCAIAIELIFNAYFFFFSVSIFFSSFVRKLWPYKEKYDLVSIFCRLTITLINLNSILNARIIDGRTKTQTASKLIQIITCECIWLVEHMIIYSNFRCKLKACKKKLYVTK